ncbi:hypothetical protein [Nocardia sp. IFM 10818]
MIAARTAATNGGSSSTVMPGSGWISSSGAGSAETRVQACRPLPSTLTVAEMPSTHQK